MKRALVLVLVLGCSAKRAAIVTGGFTVTAGVAGGSLVDNRDDRDREVGVLLCTYAALGALYTIALVATAIEGHGPATGSPPIGAGGAPAEGVTGGPTAAPAGYEPTTTRPWADTYNYDRTGAFAGRQDTSGNYYDRTGAYDGRLDDHGNYYDRTGASAGRVDDHGNYYDKTGASAGRVDDSGNFYDRTGASAGRIDGNGNVYDATGAYAGRVDDSCDDACRRAAVGRILLDR